MPYHGMEYEMRVPCLLCFANNNGSTTDLRNVLSVYFPPRAARVARRRGFMCFLDLLIRDIIVVRTVTD